MKNGKQHEGGWKNLTPEQKQDRVKRMLENRARNKGKGVKLLKTRQALPAEIIHTTIPHQASGATLEALAQLIVAVWKKL